jgi:hypothetical protein
VNVAGENDNEAFFLIFHGSSGLRKAVVTFCRCNTGRERWR